jgi:hypothetical protein
MTSRKTTVLVFGVVLVVSGRPSVAQQNSDSSQCLPAYENHNQIDYRP